jgi:putative tricarboxylic transport membrane protein
VIKKYEVLVAIFWIGVSLLIMVLSYKLGIGELRKPGPGLMPFISGLLLLPFSLYLLVTSFNWRGETVEKKDNRTNLKKIGIVIVSMFVYALLMEKLGYLIATPLLLVILFGCHGFKKRWKVVLLISILTVLVTYFVFSYLGIVFPLGILKF